jgi:hypothetical protein
MVSGADSGDSTGAGEALAGWTGAARDWHLLKALTNASSRIGLPR